MFGKAVTKGVSLTHENTSSSNPIINNNININHNENITEGSGEVHYDKPYNELPKPTVEDLASQIAFLKAVLSIYMNQKFFSGKYIVCSPDELIDLVKLLTKADTVEIETEAIEVSCCGSADLPYSKVSNIWINKDGQRVIFKYNYSHLLSIFDECKISVKYVKVV